MDGASWKKIIAQIEDIYDLFEVLPIHHPILPIWREKLDEIADKTKKRKLPPGKRESATLDNIEYFLRSFLAIATTMRTSQQPQAQQPQRSQ